VRSAYLYRTRIHHGRVERVRHGFEYRHVMWLVDIDDLPVAPRGLRGLVSFRARDHFGDPAASVRSNVDTYLAEHGIDCSDGRVLVLTNPRSFGYTFNPLSVFWCYGADGDLRGIIAEVHNTYGQRHCYFVRPDGRGHAQVDKAFYVSPFFEVDGRYEMRLSEPGEHLEVAITLRRGADDHPAFTATLQGRRAPGPVRSVVGAAVRHPFGGVRVIARIRLQGFRLWLRRVPIVPRSVNSQAATTMEAETMEAETMQVGVR
jgi:uncharacterized protein